jgi:hypothetical protein
LAPKDRDTNSEEVELSLYCTTYAVIGAPPSLVEADHCRVMTSAAVAVAETSIGEEGGTIGRKDEHVPKQESISELIFILTLGASGPIASQYSTEIFRPSKTRVIFEAIILSS